MVKLVIISDTHGMHNGLKLPEGDVLIHAGDITKYGTLEDVRVFNQWLEQFSHPHKIVIAGNHDFCFEDHPKEASGLLTNATYLQDQAVEILGLKFYGSPWTPEFFNWAFMRRRGAEMRAVWEQIPRDTDVLITHGPPQGILDLTQQGEYAGSQELLEALKRVSPRFHIFGHIHEGRGVEKRDGVTFLNASSINANYSRLYPPFVIEV
jgi:Icc-related predicted phosphoesterase